MALRFRGLDNPFEVVYRKDSGAPPQPVDPYQQAAAQYGLSTGTAEFNAGLNRTNTVNPLGSSTWSHTGGNDVASGGTGYAPPPTQAAPSGSSTPSSPPPTSAPPAMSHAGTSTSPNPLSSAALGGYNGGSGAGPGLSPEMPGGYGYPPSLPSFITPPNYTQTTTLSPWAQRELQSPISTDGIAGMPGGPSTTQDLFDTRRALLDQQMSYLKPQEDLAHSELESRLANQGITPGSAAYNNAIDTENRSNTFANNQAITSAITGGGAEQSRLFGLGSQSLQDQIAARAAPINEYNSLNGAAGATANALTPDISGAFGQQYQGALAGYNANVASDNATTSAAGSLVAGLLIYL